MGERGVWRALRLPVAILLIATVAFVGGVAVAPTADAVEYPYYFQVQSVAPQCIQIGSTITVAANNVDNWGAHAPTTGAGSGFVTGWDDDVQIIVANVVVATVKLTYYVPLGFEFGYWNLPPTNITVPAGVAGYTEIRVNHRRFIRVVGTLRLQVADNSWGAQGYYMQNTCNPTTSVKPTCVNAGGGSITISGQANRYSLNVIMDDAVTIATGVAADPSGFFSATINIPAVKAGVHLLQVGSGPPGDFSDYGAPVNFVVPCSAPPPPPPTTTTSTRPPPPPSTTVPVTTTTVPVVVLGPAVLTITPPAADGGSLSVGTASAPIGLTITNSGQSPTTLGAAPVLGGPNPTEAAITADGCANLVLAPLATCSLTVVVTPADSGVRSITVTYASVDPLVAPVVATLTATGSFGAVVSVEPDVVQRAGAVTVTGTGFPASTVVELVWQGIPGTVSITTDAAGGFITEVMIPQHFGGGELTVKVVDQLPRFAGPSDNVLVQRPTAQPAGPSVGVTGRRHFWRG